MNKAATQLTRLFACMSAATLIGCGGSAETETDLNKVDPSVPVSDWVMVWNDEFNGDSINAEKWTHEVNCDGGGNNEQQCYTDSPDNSYVKDGMLHLVAKASTIDNYLYRADIAVAANPWDVNLSQAMALKPDSNYTLKFRARASVARTMLAGIGLNAAPWTNVTETVDLTTEWQEFTYTITTTDPDGAGFGDDNSRVLFDMGDQTGSVFIDDISVVEDASGTDLVTNASFDDGTTAWIVNGTGGLGTEGDAEKPFTSARLNTKNKADFKYGRFEMRAQLPDGLGSWPAFWMLPTDEVYGGWPESGEIDIVESVNLGTNTGKDGAMQTNVFGTLHYGQPWPNNVQSGKSYQLPDGVNPADGFHTYAVEWQQGEIRWYIDNHLYATQRQSELLLNAKGDIAGLNHRGWFTEYLNPETGKEEMHWDSSPFDQRFHMILNFAVGGSFPVGLSGQQPNPDDYQDGRNFVVDYVRVYECATDPVTGRGCETVRNGYDTPETEGGALVDGRAPNPPVFVDTTDFVLLDEALLEGWSLFDDNGLATAELSSDPERDAVATFSIGADNAVAGFSGREVHGGEGTSYDATGVVAAGTFSFQMRVTSLPNDTSAPWKFKAEGGSQDNGIEVDFSDSVEGVQPTEGEWQTYTFRVSQFANMDLSAIDVFMIFPQWGRGEGAVYEVSQLKVDAGASGITFFEDELNSDWALFDDNGLATAAQVVDENADFANAVEFSIGADNAVAGFSTRSIHGGTGSPFDATGMIEGGVLEFDMKVVSLPNDASAPWYVKLEGGDNTNAAEMLLTENINGTLPVEGEWQNYKFNIGDFFAKGMDVSGIDVVMIFPQWGAGNGAVYRVDNVKIMPQGGDSSGGDNGGETPTTPTVTPGLQLISNGSFDDGATGWLAGQAPLDAANIIVEDGRSVYYSQVAAAGNAWDVNLSQMLTLVPNTNYILKFKAKASQIRGLIAGIGLNAAPWTNVTETVSLSAEWQEFELKLTTMDAEGNGFGDANSRVLFDMGNEVGDVYINDVSLVADNELVINRAFDTGVAGWKATGGDAMAEDGVQNNAFFANVTVAGNPWEVNLSQVLTLRPDSAYVLTFRAKATQARNIIAGLGLNADPWHAATQSVALTTEWQTFTYNITTTTKEDGIGFGDNNSRVLFDMGHEVGGVYIDDVSVVPDQGELLNNGTFDDGIDGWDSGTVIDEDGNHVYQAAVETAGNPWEVNLSQVLTLLPATDYILTFRAKASVERGIIAGLGLNHDPWNAATQKVALTTEWRTYTYVITTIDDQGTAFGDNNSRVLFDMGHEVGTVYIDDVSLALASAFPQLVNNSTFDDDINGWNGGTVNNEEGNNFYQADVAAAGNPWEVNLSQVMTLMPGSNYVLTFRAKASQQRTMITGLGLNHDPWNASTVTLDLTTEWQTFTYSLNTTDDQGTAFGDDNSRVLFDMGADVGSVFIDDVRVFGR